MITEKLECVLVVLVDGQLHELHEKLEVVRLERADELGEANFDPQQIHFRTVSQQQIANI